MNDEQIIEMAKQAGAIPIHKDFDQLALIGTENVKAFAKLVAEHEREACAKVCEDYGRAEEMQAIGNDFAQAIRARGQT